ncbi:hypothetical protein [Actinomyces sp. HMSC065F11]|uniref:hypothetical protein n=1 Tax=Actinomyces sp. HMSC065F11 TaxID=1739395 RepID=UPI0008A5A4AA|nr:hypothetical protein [Actinomyces sp. HMSC065F11]OFR32718.1 hypothetical protein HMPREF2891_07440 [Actinomyces sp. HMSC065F11]
MATEEKAATSLVRPGFIISALLVVALILGLAFLLFTREDTGNAGGDKPVEVSTTTQTNGDAANAAPTGNAGQAESDSVCGLVARDQVIPTQALPSVPVEVGTRIQVPSIDGYGPGVREGVSHCFAHNPSGAILAAANFMTWFSSTEQLDEVVPALMAKGPNRDRLESQIKAEWQGETGSAFTIHGFKYEDRGPDNAMVVLAVSHVAFPDKIAGWPLVLTWQDGDWKVEAPSTDSWGERMIDSLQLEGFIEWGA